MITERHSVMRTWVSRFYSDDQKRHADIIVSNNGHEVDMFEDDIKVRSQPCWEHSRQYAEDCAENWVMRVIK